MGNETEIRKLNEMIRDYKSGKLHLKGYEFMALSEYLNSLKGNK
jgi:hypothetical protein